MQELKQQVTEIKNALDAIAKSRGEERIKAVIQCDNSHNTRMALHMLLDPNFVFHLGEKSFRLQVPPVRGFYTDFLSMCDELARAPAVNNAMLGIVKNTLAMLENPELSKFAENFLCKSIRLGVTGKTVNSILGREFIPEFQCMLAHKYADYPNVLKGNRFFVTEKLDGVRCIVLLKATGPELYTRHGQRIYGLTEIESELMPLCTSGGDMDDRHALDGELIVADRDGIPSKEQYKRTVKIVRSKGEKRGIVYHVFDMLPLVSFLEHGGTETYRNRRFRLDSELTQSAHVEIVPVLYDGHNESVISKLLDEQRKLRHEGVMINLADSPYAFGRTACLLKVKVMQDADLRITGVQEGSGRLSGTLGALIVDYKGTPVGVGSGLSDAMRHEIWSNPQAYIGRVAAIQYFEETMDKDGNPSLRFPVFLEIREKEKEVSYD